MKCNKKWYVLFTLLLAVATIPAFAQGQQSGRPKTAMAGKRAPLFRMTAFLRGLDLTPTQKEQIKNVMTAYKPEIKTTAKEYVSARLALKEVIQANPTNTDPWQSPFKRLTEAEWNGLLLKERIRRDIFKLLTPEQIAKIEAEHQDFTSRIDKWLDR